MANPQAEIDLQEEIGIMVSIVNLKTGEIVEGATLENISWNQDVAIGNITPSPLNPLAFVFKPLKPGTVNISLTAQVNLP